MNLKDSVTKLAALLAIQKIEAKGADYSSAIPVAIKEACMMMDIDYKSFIEKCRRESSGEKVINS